MAKIPRIGPPVKTITSQTAGVIRQATPSVAGAIASEVGGVINTIDDARKRVKKANNLAERTKAENELQKSLLDIKARAEIDTDLSDERHKQYQTEINKARSNASNFIKDETARNMFMLESESKTNILNAQLGGIRQKKVIDKSKVDLEVFFKNKEDEFIQAQSAGAKHSVRIERNNKILQMLDAGYLTNAEAQKQVTRLDEQWARSQVEYDIQTDPQFAREMLKGKEYKKLSEKERVAYLDAVDIEMRRRSKASEDNLYSKFIEGSLSIPEIQEASIPQEDGGIGSKKADTLMNKLIRQQNREVKDITKDDKTAKKYIETVNKVLTSRTENFDAKQVLVDAMADGVIDSTESKKMAEINKVLNDMKWDKNDGRLASAWKAITGWSDRSTENATMLRKLISNPESQINPESVAEDIMKQAVFEKYPYRRKYEPGKIYTEDGITFKFNRFISVDDMDVEVIR